MKSLGSRGTNGAAWWSSYYGIACVCILTCLLVMGCARSIVYRTTPDQVPKMSYTKAKRTVSKLWKKAEVWFQQEECLIQVSFTKDRIHFSNKCPGGKIYWADVDIASMNDPYVTEDIHVIIDKGVSGQVLAYRLDRFRAKFHDLADATAFADALYVMKSQSGSGMIAEETAFKDMAKNYRDLHVKPALPEAVQQCRVVAEDAIRNRDIEKAVDYYEQGLAIEPLWPEGQFNAALLYGEINDYVNAVLHMRRYLELVPDAPDAKAARDQIAIWQSKMKQ